MATERFPPDGCWLARIDYRPPDGVNSTRVVRTLGPEDVALERAATPDQPSVVVAVAWPEYPWKTDSWRIAPDPCWVRGFQRWFPDYCPRQIPFPPAESWEGFWQEYREWNGPPREPDWSAVRRVLLLPPFDFAPADVDSFGVADVVTYLESRLPPAGGVAPGVTPPKMGARRKRFRVALSFPGERREFVAQVADILAASLGRDRVLYDKYLEAELARPDLDTYLQRLYHDESDLNAVFLCADYERKEWCGLEWRAIRDLIKRREASRVMLLRFDDTEIPGLFTIDGYVTIGDRTPDVIASLILERLRINTNGAVANGTSKV